MEIKPKTLFERQNVAEPPSSGVQVDRLVSKPLLLHGDCLDFFNDLPIVDAVITDPPYMLGAASARKSANKAIGWADINNAANWYAQWFSAAWNRLDEHGGMWIFGNWKTLPVYQCAASKVPGMSIISIIVWDREWPGVGSMRGLRQHYELIVLFGKPAFSIIDRSTPDIWKCKWASSRPTGHPQEKPVALIERMIERSGLPPGATVLDPFMGSGTTGVACKNSGINFIGVELDDMNFQIATKRIEAC